jgi:hypothetical protein
MVLIKMKRTFEMIINMRLFLIKERFLIIVIKKGFCTMKWKWAGSGSARDI